jgi:hypothetical protein
MAYIGKTPVIGNFQKCDSITVVNGQAAYTLQVGGTNVSPQSENHMLVSLNGILQAPTDSFTVSGSTLTFASNLITGDVIDFVMILGNVLDLGVPSDNTVSLAKLTATGTKDATTFLRGDNTFAEAGGGKVLQAVTGTSSTASQGSETSFTDTGLNVTITPSSASSKILVMAHTTGLIDSNGSFVYFTIERQISGGSNTNIGDSSIGLSHMRGDTVNISNVMVHALDSPSTTSAITYEFQRRVSADSGAAMYQGVKSNITALEIGA